MTKWIVTLFSFTTIIIWVSVIWIIVATQVEKPWSNQAVAEGLPVKKELVGYNKKDSIEVVDRNQNDSLDLDKEQAISISVNSLNEVDNEISIDEILAALNIEY
ncbi:hypothetical protein [Aquibacillus saliphilus]|uniref:hypothetical protein n=1 Tax=Aquibacillus saliphilus TaxID=1909422 RepID=UPI001CF08684|nr:hypothetical protein [Aquibacillus saliphilus]